MATKHKLLSKMVPECIPGPWLWWASDYWEQWRSPLSNQRAQIQIPLHYLLTGTSDKSLNFLNLNFFIYKNNLS